MPIEVDGITNWKLFLLTGNWQSSSGARLNYSCVNTCFAPLFVIVPNTVPAILEVIVIDVEVHVSSLYARFESLKLDLSMSTKKNCKPR